MINGEQEMDDFRDDAETIAELRAEVARLTRERDEARDRALVEAAGIASNACLVPPDGGNPTKEEADVCEEAYRRILALRSTSPAPSEAVREKVAVAMWRQEANRAATASVARGRTPDAFRDQSSDTRKRWLGLADAALRALASEAQTRASQDGE